MTSKSKDPETEGQKKGQLLEKGEGVREG